VTSVLGQEGKVTGVGQSDFGANDRLDVGFGRRPVEGNSAIQAIVVRQRQSL